MLKALHIKFLLVTGIIGCSVSFNTTHTVPNEVSVSALDSVKHDNPVENIIQSPLNDRKEMRVALLLPFYTNEIEYDSLGISITSVSEKSIMATQYFRGVQLALDSLDHEGIKMKVNVYDTRRDTDRLKNILSLSDVVNADVVIGPVSNIELTVASKICGERKQVLISPLSSSYNLAGKNKNFVLANAGLKTHCEALAEFINSKYSSARVIMVYRRETESVYASYFKDKLKTKPIELTEKSDSNCFHIDDFISAINPNIIIIPSFDEEFVSILTKQLHGLSTDYTFYVFGMPTWKDMETLRLDYLQSIHTHISSSYYSVDTISPFKQIRSLYKSKFNSRPDEFSYQGYSIFLFIGSLWKENNNKWFEHIDDENEEAGVNFNIQPMNSNTSETEFLENKNVFILEFKNNSLIKVK